MTQPTRVPVDIPGGLNSDDTTFSAAPAWADGSHVRFARGRPQVVPGWESLIAQLLAGVCRAALGWTDNTNVLNIALGTHSNLQLWQGEVLYDITPDGPPVLLAANPLSVVNASPIVTVSQPAHGYANGISVAVSGAAAIGGITPNGTFVITVTGPDAYTFNFGSNATGTVAQPPGGGGSAVVVVPQVLLPAGAIDGTGGQGFGTGSFGVGAFGAPSTTDYFPRTWSLAPWGQFLVASPRNGGLYKWSGVPATPAQAVPTAPPQITQMGVSPQRQVFAFGCTQENGLYNPLCLRHSSIGDETEWATDATSSSTAREYVLPGGGRIVGHLFVGQYVLVWTSVALFLGTYVGQLTQVWRFDKVGEDCGLVGPNAAAAVGSTAFWIGPDLQFRSYALGGAVDPVECQIRKDFADNLTPAQADKIMASTTGAWSEVRWDYPDQRDVGFENSRYVALAVAGPDAGSWYRGRALQGVSPARTARIDAGPADFPIGVTAGGNIYYEEKGASADGGPLPWLLASADIYLDLDVDSLVTELWPDLSSDQLGAVTLVVTSREEPDDSRTAFGPFMIAPGQRLVDVGKISGRIFGLTYSGFSSPAYVRIGKLVAKAKPRGRRA
jgi:hypothetical protein